ncbi:MAG TPA: DUF6235 family protein [Pseudonocardiaceae bacterium]|nr:DUF6235 family protein [Pseudonocardiaceae bacterium]
MTQERKKRRLNLGVGRLEDWAATASQIDKNAVYDVLFAVSDGTVFRSHVVLDDVQRAGEFFVLARENLVVKVSIQPFDTFGVLYIGPNESIDVRPA